MRVILLLIFLYPVKPFVAAPESVFSSGSKYCQHNSLTISTARAWTEDQNEENTLQEGLRISEKYSKGQEENERFFLFNLTTEVEKRPAIQQSSLQTTIIRTLNTSIILSLGCYAASIGLGEMLSHFEWFQTFRYFWPFSLGCLFVYEGIVGGVVPFRLATGMNEKWIAVIGGLGLIIGGAYDAFMPIWSTGPNVFTHAGLNQDSAAVLLLLSIYSILVPETGNSSSDNENSNGVLPLQMLLLGQLYKLGEGTFDEILSNLNLIP